MRDQLQTIPGVAEVRLFGEREYSMRIWLDPERLAAYQLTPQDVEAALRRQNVEVPSGRIESQQREFTVLAETDLRTPQQFNDLIIKDANGYLVRLSDVGHAELGALDERRVVRFNGNPAIALGVVKQATANPLDVSEEVRKVLPSITESLPDGMEVKVAHDKSVFIAESIKNVYRTIGEAILLVVLIIFLFLRSARATLIPLVTIPVSLIGAFALMYAFGFSINTLTLLALVLAIGLVVDDAIVMLENIYRHVENGMTPVKAALVGSREISFAIVAMTITLAAVYAPIGFMTGITGRLFTEFAWTLAGAVIVSGFVALTLSPMMCSKLLRQQSHHNLFYRIIEAFLNGITLFADPFIIMLTVPLSVTGALLALWWTGGTLNIYSQVGLVTLIGLITKHGILIVEFANQLRVRGRPMREAVIESATLRLRPILMTTGAMVLGAVPLALATGAGAESRQDIGWVIVGGLLVGTLFTLFVIPVVYTYSTKRVFIEADEDAVPDTILAPAESKKHAHVPAE